MFTKNFRAFAAVGLTAGAVALAAPGLAQEASPEWQQVIDAAKAEGSVTIYSSQGLKQLNAMAEQFTAKYGIPVEIVRGVETDFSPKVDVEFESGKGIADLVVQTSLITLASQGDGLVYSMAKAINTEYPKFKDAMPELKGWALERQAFKWAVPYHKGAVRYWKEIGAWTADMDTHNNKLLKRQEVLAAAWAGVKNSKADGDAFKKEWGKVRAEALKKAGFIP